MNNKENLLTEQQITRIKTFGRRVWNSLTEEERENYACDLGTFGFLEDVMTMLRLQCYSFKSTEDFEACHDDIIYHETSLTPENLNSLADELRCNVENRFDTALLTIVETLAGLDDGDQVSYSCGNIGIGITKDYIDIVDIEASKSILTLEVTE